MAVRDHLDRSTQAAKLYGQGKPDAAAAVPSVPFSAVWNATKGFDSECAIEIVIVQSFIVLV